MQQMARSMTGIGDSSKDIVGITGMTDGIAV